MPQYQGIWTLQDAARLQSQQQWATDPLFDYTTLLLQADNAPNAAQNNTFLDSSANAFTITRNGNTTQGTFTPFSATGWSNYFDGSGDYLSVPANAAFQFGTGDFCIEFWYYPLSFGTQTPIDMGYTNTGSYVLQNASDGKTYFYTGSIGVVFTSGTAYTLNAWNHLVVCRNGTNLSMFLNGQRTNTVTNSTNFNANFSLGIGASAIHSTPYEINGYLSNVRLVKGSSVYDPTASTLTIPTAPLTAITNTSILTCQSNRFRDASTNNFTLTPTGTPSVQAFAPFAPQFQYTPTVIGGSGYFDGTTDYLTVANSTAFQLGTGDFTMECWYYAQDISLVAIFGLWGPSSSNASWLMYTDASGNPQWYTSTNGSTLTASLTSSRAITLNAWNHIVIERVSGTTTIYVNGASGGSTSTSVNLFAATSQLSIGYNPIGGTPDNVVGYLSGLRLVKGAYVYNGAFTPPTSPPTAVSGTSLLCNFTNAAITDGTMKNNLETVGNAQVSTSPVKYGAGSMAFDGSGDYLSSVSNAVNNLSGDFTVEAWIYRAVIGVLHPIFDLGDYIGASGLLFYVTSGNALAIFTNNGLAMSGGTIPATTWTHVALVRSGSGSGNTRLYVNGVSVGTPATNTATFSGRLLVGADLYNTAITNFMNGYIDDLRVTRGIARYTANFTPPQVALPRQ